MASGVTPATEQVADIAAHDWLVTFARKVAEERDYSARHPGHVFLVMLKEEEAEGLLLQINDESQVLGELRQSRFDPECECCRVACRLISGNKSWPK